jgi:hypothetical protein
MALAHQSVHGADLRRMAQVLGYSLHGGDGDLLVTQILNEPLEHGDA